MAIRKFLTSSIVSFALLFSGTALANFKADIIASCEAYQLGEDKSAINPCKLYIDGFIDSSLISQDAAIKPKELIERRLQPTSDFMQRAYKTRVSNRLSDLYKEYQFCLPSEYDRKSIASGTAKSLNIDALKDKSLSQVVLETLTRNYPCGLDNTL